MEARSKALDILRAFAVFLVIGHHAGYFRYDGTNKLVASIATFFDQGGWVGVDLFFVLSGFLISGLLFREHQRFNSISFKRFFIRRGFKIYPSFYVLIVITIFVRSVFGYHTKVDLRQLLCESFFVQDYVYPMWQHTWSLGVEEKFYLFFPVLLIFLTKIPKYKNQPFKAIPLIFLLLAISVLGLRFLFALMEWNQYSTFHSRMDSLFFGVVISYYYHYHQPGFKKMTKTFKYFLLVFGVALLVVPGFVKLRPWEPNMMSVSGFTFLYLGCGMILMALLQHNFKNTMLVRTLAYIGAHSYSIYLWHIPVAIWGPESLNRLFATHLGWYASILIYIIGSIILGILASKAIEFPTLRLRDSLFPSRSLSLAFDSDTNRIMPLSGKV